LGAETIGVKMVAKKEKPYAKNKSAISSKRKKRSGRDISMKKAASKKEISSEATELQERTQWKKERREYWQHRFRQVLSKPTLKSKAKQVS